MAGFHNRRLNISFPSIVRLLPLAPPRGWEGQPLVRMRDMACEAQHQVTMGAYVKPPQQSFRMDGAEVMAAGAVDLHVCAPHGRSI